MAVKKKSEPIEEVVEDVVVEETVEEKAAPVLDPHNQGNTSPDYRSIYLKNKNNNG
jgi:hypothetical protein